MRALIMPIRAYLEGVVFDPEIIRRMGIAFETALASLRSTPACADPVRETIARKIIELVKAGERDPERLCQGALNDLPPVVSVPSRASPPTGSPLPHGENSC